MRETNSVRERIGAVGVAFLVALSLLAGIGAVSAGGMDDASESSPTASVTFENQTTDGETVVVEEVTMEEGGFVAIHNASLLDGDALGSVVGVSAYLEPGTHEDVEITLFDVKGQEFDRSALDEDETLIAMPHFDTNDNDEYDFVATEGGEDGPYTADGEAVVDDATVTVEHDDAESGESQKAEKAHDADTGDDTEDGAEAMEVTADDVEMAMGAMGMDAEQVEEETGMSPQDIADMLNEFLDEMATNVDSA